MPIPDAELERSVNKFIAVSGEATVGQAIAALQAQQGEPWWHLLVRKPDGAWGSTTFTELYNALAGMPDAADMRLADWEGLVPATTVEWDAMGMTKARGLARNSPGKLVVVTDGGMPKGILFEGSRRSDALRPLSVGQFTKLAGQYVNLKDYGAILMALSGSILRFYQGALPRRHAVHRRDAESTQKISDVSAYSAPLRSISALVALNCVSPTSIKSSGSRKSNG